MTNHDENLPSAALTDTGPDQTPVDDRPLPADATGVICQAESVEIGLGEDDEDPFDATFLLAGTDSRGREVAVWIRLTPTNIDDLTEQLAEVLLAQQQILGVNGFHRTTDESTPTAPPPTRTIRTPGKGGPNGSSTPWGSDI